MNYFMRRLISVFLISLISNLCYAGMEHELLLKQYNECVVRVTHDATPDSETGTIIFRSYIVKDGVNYPCEINETTASTSLNKATQQYLLQPDLKPVTSIMLGRLIRYPWARSFLDKDRILKVTHQEFNKIIFDSPVIEPFVKALQDTGYKITNVSCEKILYNEDGFAIDALCWLVIEK